MKYGLFILTAALLLGCSPACLEEYNKGLKYMSEGKADIAEGFFRKATELNPEFGSAYEQLAKSYIAKGWLDGAEMNARKAIDILETTKITITGIPYEQVISSAYNTLGEVEIGKAKESQQSLDLNQLRNHLSNAAGNFNKALQLYPKNTAATANLQKVQKLM